MKNKYEFTEHYNAKNYLRILQTDAHSIKIHAENLLNEVEKIVAKADEILNTQTDLEKSIEIYEKLEEQLLRLEFARKAAIDSLKILAGIQAKKDVNNYLSIATFPLANDRFNSTHLETHREWGNTVFDYGNS